MNEKQIGARIEANQLADQLADLDGEVLKIWQDALVELEAANQAAEEALRKAEDEVEKGDCRCFGY